MRLVLAVVLAVIPAIALAGCSSSENAPSERPDVKDQISSIASIRDKVDYAVTGKVTAWHPGPKVMHEDRGSEHAVLELASTEVIKTTSAKAEPKFVLIRLGQYGIDGQGKIVNDEPRAPARTLHDVERALPIGTRVIALGNQTVFEEPGNVEYDPEPGLGWQPLDGSLMISPYPQGLLVETLEGGYDSGLVGPAEVEFGQSPTSFEALLRDVRDEANKRPAIQASVLRGGGSIDYPSVPSVAALRDTADDVISGTVSAWHQGPIITDRGRRLADNHAVIELASATVIKAGSKDAEPRFILIELGQYGVDGQGEIIEPTNGSGYTARTMTDVKNALPIGTRVLALGSTVNAKMLGGWTPIDGSVPISTYPQGLLLETADGSYDSGWVEPSDVMFGQWPRSASYRGSTAEGAFEALLRDVSRSS